MNTKLIAEIGINHNGSLTEAKKLVFLAAKAKVDFIKFQIYKTERLVTGRAKKSPYQKKSIKDKENQFEMLKRYELTFLEHKKIQKFCKKNKLNYTASPFDEESLFFLKSMKPKFIKIGSGEITNFFLLNKAKTFNGEIILSTGMSYIKEVEEAYRLLKTKNNKVIYCQVTI